MAGLSYLVSKDSFRSPLGALSSRASPYPIIYAFIRKVLPYSLIKVLRCLLISLVRGRRCNYASVSFPFSVFCLVFMFCFGFVIFVTLPIFKPDYLAH